MRGVRISAGLVCVVFLAITMSKTARADPNATAGDKIATLGPTELIDRFLASSAPKLTSYRARRTLTASTRGGRMTASLEAWTMVDPNGRFEYEITNEDGSELIRRHVLVAALEEERRAHTENDNSAELTHANYFFDVDDDRGGDLLRIHLRPRRKSSMLIEGTAFVTHDALDMVRMEGELSKRPSFWTRRVEITRMYARIGGVRVPVEVQSHADVRLVGASTFSMVYDYITINGQPVR